MRPLLTLLPVLLASIALAAPALAQDDDAAGGGGGPDPRAAAHHAAAAAYNAKHAGQSLLVMVGGEVVFEDYPNGGAADTASRLASGTKSFCGIMAVAAAGDGLLALDEKVSDTITEWQADGRREITIRQLIGLTSGIDPGKTGTIPTYAASVEAELLDPPGTKFRYGPVPFQVFGELMRRKLLARGEDEDPLGYLERRVLKKIGLVAARWQRDADGHARLPSGAHLTAREWAKLGELVRRGGEWGGEPVLDAERLKELFVPQRVQPRYGVSFWLGAQGEAEGAGGDDEDAGGTETEPDEGPAALPDDLVMAAGAGKQRLYIVPSLDLVVVRQTGRATAAETVRYRDEELLARLLHGTNAAGGSPEEEAPAAGPRAGRAQDPARRAERLMKRSDANGDGQLSADEMPERLRRIFDRADADESGGVSEEELRAFLERRARRRGAGDGRRRGGSDDGQD